MSSFIPVNELFEEHDVLLIHFMAFNALKSATNVLKMKFCQTNFILETGYICSKTAMRFSIGGCVANKPPTAL